MAPSELRYLFDPPNAAYPRTLNADQQALAAGMRITWVQVMSLVSPQPQNETGFSATQHCTFWTAATHARHH